MKRNLRCGVDFDFRDLDGIGVFFPVGTLAVSKYLGLEFLVFGQERAVDLRVVAVGVGDRAYVPVVGVAVFADYCDVFTDLGFRNERFVPVCGASPEEFEFRTVLVVLDLVARHDEL